MPPDISVSYGPPLETIAKRCRACGARGEWPGQPCPACLVDGTPKVAKFPNMETSAEWLPEQFLYTWADLSREVEANSRLVARNRRLREVLVRTLWYLERGDTSDLVRRSQVAARIRDIVAE